VSPPTTKPAKPPATVLPAASVHAWRIQRQLLGTTKAGTPEQVARHLIGVQAQVTSSAALSIALRLPASPAPAPPASGRRHATDTAPADGAPVEATAAALRDRRLVRSWAMRGTLHLFAADDVPTIAAALGRKENWRRPAWLRWFAVTEREMDQLIDAIGDVLDDGRARSRAELADEIGARLGPRIGKLLLGSWGSALKIASDRHYLCQSSEDAAGTRFVKASRWIEGWRDEDPDEALASLVPRYLAAYGPATLKELLRWWGMSEVVVMKPVIAALGSALAEVEVDGVRAYVRSEDVDDIAATRPTRDDVQLVGGFDPFIVGAGLREALLPAAHLKRVSRTAGWISPVVLIDGVARGVWDMARVGERLRVTVEPFAKLTAVQRNHIGRAADRVAAAYRSSAMVDYGAVFPVTKR
jgi:hypothetical protein